MQVESKFEIGQLVAFKRDTLNGLDIQLQEIKEIQTQTCYAGTQVFYLSRTIFLKRSYKDPNDRAKGYRWRFYHGIGQGDNSTGWHKYREDEFDPVPKFIEQMLENIKNQAD